MFGPTCAGTIANLSEVDHNVNARTLIGFNCGTCSTFGFCHRIDLLTARNLRDDLTVTNSRCFGAVLTQQSISAITSDSGLPARLVKKITGNRLLFTCHVPFVVHFVEISSTIESGFSTALATIARYLTCDPVMTCVKF